MLSLVRKYRYLIVSMVTRDLREQYTGSLLGLLWMVLRPLAWMAVYSFALSVVLKARTRGVYQDIPFPVWLLTGLLPFAFFSEAAGRSVASVTGRRNLIKKSLFDKRILPLVTVTGSLVNHIVGLVVLIIVMLYFRVHFLRLTLLWLPVITVVLYMYVLGWAYFLASLQVYLRDMSQMIIVALQLLFFLTPIIYPEILIPPCARGVMKINPHYFIVRFYREIILLGQNPNWLALAAMSVGCLVFYRLGRLVFDRLSPGFADAL
jgi:lipopolysaccharide transport system permease protein